eukprot:Gb_06114 [translate_table: standard]
MEKPGQCYWVLAFIAVFSMVPVTGGHDSITLRAGIAGNQTIVSKNGTFELGFFSPSGSNRWYIGIWYAKIALRTYVWVANRENPINGSSNSAALKFTEKGRLGIIDSNNVSVWETENGEPASRAVILDSGNLVLMAAVPNPGSVVWESFEHPADTWLPGMKMSFTQKLTSWKSMTDPAPGDFALELKFKEFRLVWRDSVPYWTSGVWNGESFNYIPEMTVKYIYNFSFVNPDSPDGYFIYTELPQSNVMSRFAVDKLGVIRQYTWTYQTNNWEMFWYRPKEKCWVYGLCGSNGVCDDNGLGICHCLRGFEPRTPVAWESQDWSGGCVRSSPLQCGSKDEFYGFGNAFVEGRNNTSIDGKTKDSCEKICLKNCSCSGYAYKPIASECILLIGDDILNLRNSSDENDEEDFNNNNTMLFVRLAPCDMPEKNITKPRKTIPVVLIGAICGFGAFSVVIALNFLFWKRWISDKKSIENPNGAILSMFTYKELQIATKNFSEKLGSGGFGSVYRGNLPGSIPIAVKKLERPEGGEKQFRMEVSTIGTIQHVNLVRLRGFCSEGNRRLLVYDYMPNGSLNAFLFRDQHNFLDWKTRFRIALGTARAIAYLHEECRDCIIHCDIKPENILLDADFDAKVSDFGLAKFIGRDFSRVLTSMRGTRGYLAPEWISGLPITAKADVYSFGMTLLEIVGGRRNIEMSNVESEKWFFPPWAAKQISLGNVLELVDERLGKDIDVEQARRAAMVAIWCIQDDEGSRPTMGTIVKMLEGIVEVSTPPVPRTLQALMDENGVAQTMGKDSEMTSPVSSSPSSIVVADDDDAPQDLENISSVFRD